MSARDVMFNRPWAAPALIFIAALLLFSLNLERPPHADELHHVLAAEHLFDTGRPIIADGEYTRGILYTWLVAVSYELFGQSLTSARLPAVLLVSLLAPMLFVWIRRQAGVLSAWITAILFVTSPFVVEIAQFSRFYALQMMFFTSAAICMYHGVLDESSLARRAALLGAAIVLLALSVWVQDTTFIGLVAIGVWVAGCLLFRVSRNLQGKNAVWVVAAIAALAAILLAIAVSTFADDLAWAWRRYRTASLFAADSANEFWYYHLRYVLFYPTLWPLIGVLAICAAARNARLAWFSVTIFGVSFLMTSFAAQKATRYFSYVQPLLAVIWGVGLGYALPLLCKHVADARSLLAQSLAVPAKWKSKASQALVVLSVAVVILANPFWLRTATMIGDVALPLEAPMADWRAARGVLAPWVASAEIMVTTEELGAIYFLGRSDVRYSPSKFDELPREQRFEFGIDPRVGRPIITTPASLESLIRCFDSGLVVGPANHWGDPTLISAAVQDVLKRNAHTIDVPKNSHLYAWGWKRTPGQPRASTCGALDRFSRSGLHE